MAGRVIASCTPSGEAAAYSLLSFSSYNTTNTSRLASYTINTVLPSIGDKTRMADQEKKPAGPMTSLLPSLSLQER